MMDSAGEASNGYLADARALLASMNNAQETFNARECCSRSRMCCRISGMSPTARDQCKPQRQRS
jgi:hypothetical protein